MGTKIATAPTEIIKDLDRLREVINYAYKTKVFAFDFETADYEKGTGGLEYHNKDQVVTALGLCFFPGQSFTIPFEHKFKWSDVGTSLEEVLEIIRPIFKSPDIHKIGHNVKFDHHWLTRYSIAMTPRVSDTMIMAHILDENRKHGLKDLTTQYFPHWSGYDDGVDFAGPLEPLCKYLGADCDITLRLWYIFEYQLSNDYVLYRLYRNLVMPSILMLQEVEYRGALVDTDRIVKAIKRAEELLEKKEKTLKSFSEVNLHILKVNQEKIQEKITQINEKINNRRAKNEIKKQEKILKLTEQIQKEEVGSKKYLKVVANFELIKSQDVNATDNHLLRWSREIRELKTNKVALYTEINFGSTAQVASLFYDTFKFEVPKVQGVKKRATGSDNLTHIDHPIIDKLFAYRTIKKMLSTYYKPLLEKADIEGRVHASFRPMTDTGRLKCSNPNLQNIPQRINYDDDDALEVLKQVKQFFIPPKDNYLLQFDYSQAELRVIANIADDPTMKKLYLEDKDLHSMTAANIVGVTIEEFYKLPKDEQKKNRTKAKAAIFGWVYGSSIDGYINYCKSTYNIDITKAEAQRHKDAVFNTYTKLNRWHRVSENRGRKQGYVETLFGRRRRLLKINSSDDRKQSDAARKAINSPIQGTAGELTLFCMILLRFRLPSDCLMWLNVHDAVYTYLPKDKLTDSRYIPVINDTCENPPLKEFFDIDEQEVGMKMDYSLSETTWGDFEEIGDFNTLKKVLNFS